MPHANSPGSLGSCRDTPAAHYRARAETLHEQAQQSPLPEARESLDRVAHWYEILARYVERRRNPITR